MKKSTTTQTPIRTDPADDIQTVLTLFILLVVYTALTIYVKINPEPYYAVRTDLCISEWGWCDTRFVPNLFHFAWQICNGIWIFLTVLFVVGTIARIFEWIERRFKKDVVSKNI
jgi:hypothetical protein